MKTIVSLISINLSLGPGRCPDYVMGEGYSSTQLAFFNAPSSSTFEPNVQKYWGNYITSQQNLSIKSATSNMDIWMNTFPLKFDTPLQFKATSFAANAAALSSHCHGEEQPVSDQKCEQSVRRQSDLVISPGKWKLNGIQ